MSKGSRDGLLEREQEVMRILGLFIGSRLDFIVVGGYAITTYKKRFSVDLDIIVREQDFTHFRKVIEKEGFIFFVEKQISLAYGENFRRYVKLINNFKVNIDFLMNGLVSRKTNASWSFEYVHDNSVKRKLVGLEFLTPEKELLIAMKLHSGRLSDTRDIVALMPCDRERLKKHVFRGDINALKNSIKNQALFLGKPQFDDSFKGIFGIHQYDLKDVDAAKEILSELEEDK